MKKYLLLFLLFSSSVSAQTTINFSVNLDAGRLRGFGGATALTADNRAGQGSTTGSLLLLIAVGADGALSNTLTTGQFVSGDDKIVASAGFNTFNGTDETQSPFTASTTEASGERLALRWFPSITLQQFRSSTATPSALSNFGTYTPRAFNATDAPDGGSGWLIPTGGLLTLNFFTTDSDNGGTQAPIEGFANSVVGVPEPSTALWFGVALTLFIGSKFYRRCAV